MCGGDSFWQGVCAVVFTVLQCIAPTKVHTFVVPVFLLFTTGLAFNNAAAIRIHALDGPPHSTRYIVTFASLYISLYGMCLILRFFIYFNFAKQKKGFTEFAVQRSKSNFRNFMNQ